MPDTVSFKTGDTLFAQGSTPQEMFTIASGQVTISKTSRGRTTPVAKHGPGDMIGELELIDGKPRLATVTADEPTVCERVGDTDFNQRFEALPLLFQSVLRNMIASMRANEEYFSSNILTTVFIGKFPDDRQDREEVTFDKGAQIIATDEKLDVIYIIRSGLVELSIAPGGRRRVMSMLGRNCLFGVTPMVDGLPSFMAARALEQTHCQIVTRAEFEAGLAEIGMFKTIIENHARSMRQRYDLFLEQGKT